MKIQRAIDTIVAKVTGTQYELSVRLNTSPEQVSRWRNGRTFPQHRMLRSLERLLGEAIEPEHDEPGQQP